MTATSDVSHRMRKSPMAPQTNRTSRGVPGISESTVECLNLADISGDMLIENPSDSAVKSNDLPKRQRRRPDNSDLSIRHRRSVNHTTEACDKRIKIKKTQKVVKNESPSSIPVPVAVIMWYFLGVIAIASSKVLLSTCNVPPLFLTLQQLLIGITVLRTLMRIQTKQIQSISDCDGSISQEKLQLTVGGLQPIPIQTYNAGIESFILTENVDATMLKRKQSDSVQHHTTDSFSTNSSEIGIVASILALISSSVHRISQRSQASGIHMLHSSLHPIKHVDIQLLLASIYFTLGFLFTNMGFQSGSAAFVETIKAAEPITSASTAVVWGIERLGKEECLSLSGIVLGVILSTLGHVDSDSRFKKPNATTESSLTTGISMNLSLVRISGIIMLANLCFSFRGLHQKILRATPQGKVSAIDDLNLQYRMQQIGVLMLVTPVLLESSTSMWNPQQYLLYEDGKSLVPILLKYIPLAFINGVAFSLYNLASTYILSRISVVHHAALNCIRRVFAIIITSIIFGLTITLLQVVGITISVGAFFSYNHYKVKRVSKETKQKDLRKKYGLTQLKSYKRANSDECKNPSESAV